MQKKLLSLALLLAVSNSFALIDYSDEDESSGPVKKSVKKISKSSSPSNGQGGGLIELAMKYDSTNVTTQDGRSGTIDTAKTRLFMQTPHSLFMDLSYWQAGSNDLYSTSSYQKGNPVGIIGFNWFKFGQGSEAARVDLYAGYSMKATNSLFGSSRNDMIYGVHSSKRILDFALAFGGEYRNVGTVNDTKEMQIGDITRLHASLGWVATQDIRFSVETNMYTVKAATSSKDVYHLSNNLNFATISPKLLLGLTPNVELEMGASFQTRKAQVSDKENENMLDARLNDLQGAYGSSLFAGLNISV